MNWDAAAAIAEIVGAVAVVISLVYLATQIRSQTRESRLNSTRELAHGFRELIGEVSSDPDLFELYRQSLQNYEGLPDNERMRIHMQFYSRIFGMHEQVHLHLKHENVDPVFFESITNRFVEFARSPGPRMWWNRNRDIYSAGFRAYIDTMLDRDSTQE